MPIQTEFAGCHSNTTMQERNIARLGGCCFWPWRDILLQHLWKSWERSINTSI